jgi:DNA adenine methylase
MVKNGLVGGEYAEPYAGGAGVALFLAIEGYASRVHINDLDQSIYAFWHAVVKNPDALCKLIRETEVSIDEWKRQKAIQQELRKTSLNKEGLLRLGFSTFFLNRTNRSGIIRGGGVIGGLEQNSKWGIDSRYYADTLIERIERIAHHRDLIRIYNWDAVKFLRKKVPQLSSQSLIYLDPPYVENGDNLYQNDYTLKGHRNVAEAVYEISTSWLVSYDNSERVNDLYKDYNSIVYDLSYSARRRYQGSEVMFISNDLTLPEFEHPTGVTKDQLQEAISDSHQPELMNAK